MILVSIAIRTTLFRSTNYAKEAPFADRHVWSELHIFLKYVMTLYPFPFRNLYFLKFLLDINV